MYFKDINVIFLSIDNFSTKLSPLYDLIQITQSKIQPWWLGKLEVERLLNKLYDSVCLDSKFLIPSLCSKSSLSILFGDLLTHRL